MDTLLGILGPTTLFIDGAPDDRWGKPKERAVLAVLATQPGKVVSHERLMRWAWDDEPPRNPVEVLHMYATRIRKALRRLPEPPDLRAGQGGYRLEMNPSHIDRNRFRELVSQGRAHVTANEPERAVAVIDDALSLWRGDPLADVMSAAAAAWRTSVLQNELLAAHKTLVEQLVAVHEYDEAIARLDDLIAGYPDDVTLATLRLTALHRSRQGTNATTFYLTMRHRLTDRGDVDGAEHLRRSQDALVAEQQVPLGPRPEVPPPHMLPHEHPCFVGREEQLAQLDELTGVRSGTLTPGVVIVDGIGGVGKTALALRWAHRRRHLFPGGELFVNLCGYTAGHAKVDPATVVDDFLGALGQSPDHGSPRARAQLLRTLLNDRKALVVLDNAYGTPHVRDLVSLMPSCLVIITSRQLLTALHRETGARRITVPVMTPEEGAALLSARLGTRSEIDEATRTGLAELCGGLPMQLSVLAELLAGKSPAGIAEHTALLDRRALVVGFGDRGDGPTSGAACYDPSYHALTAGERRLFRLLTQHPGPEFGVAAACACAGGPADEAARGLVRLAGAHLLEETAVVNRYRFHDLIAEYAAYRRDLDEPRQEQDAAARRVLAHYLDTANNACLAIQRTYNPPPPLAPGPAATATTFPDATAALRWFARERTNLTSAITFAVEHELHDHAWRLADPVSWYFDRTGRWQDSKAMREAVLPSTRVIGDRLAEASTRSGLGMTLMRLREMPEARRQLETALVLMQDEPARPQSSILQQLGQVALGQGNAREALDVFQRALAIDQESGNQEGVCWAHCRIGQALRKTDQHEAALVHLGRAAFIAHDIGETSAEATSLTEIGAIHRDLRDYPNAAAHCEKALAVAQSVPDLATVGAVCMDLCEINRDRHRSRAAVDYGHRAVAVFEQTHDVAQQARALDVLGRAHHRSGNLVDALTVWHRAVGLYDSTGNTVAATVLRAHIDAVPPFYQEIVPFARAEPEVGGWPANDEATQPLDRPPR